jgi:hypothetical protein
MHTEETQKSIPQADKQAGSYQKTAAEGRAIAAKRVGWVSVRIVGGK